MIESGVCCGACMGYRFVGHCVEESVVGHAWDTDLWDTCVEESVVGHAHLCCF